MLKEHFATLERRLAEQIAQGEDNPRKLYALEVARFGQRLYSGEHKIAWTGVLAPFELLNATGVTSCFVEFTGAMLASMGFSSTFIEESQQGGFGSDMCSYHRAILGAQRKGLIPSPNFLVATSCPCSGGMAVMEILAHSFQKPLLVLHIPQEENERNVRYLANQLEELHNFIAQEAKEPRDDAKLAQAIEHANRTRETLLELYELARHVPSPVANNDLANFAYIINLLMGTPHGTRLAQNFVDAFAKRVRAGSSGVDGEKRRLLWIQNRIQFKNPFISLLEKEYRAAIVIDEMNCVTWEKIEPQDPYMGIARRIIGNPFNGPAQRRLENLQRLARAYRVDGALNPCNWGCRQGAGARGIIGKGLNEIGVPVLNLETDCADKRNFFEGQLRTRLAAFMEMLEENAQRKGNEQR